MGIDFDRFPIVINLKQMLLTFLDNNGPYFIFMFK